MQTPSPQSGTTVRRDLLAVAAGIVVAAFASVHFELSEAVQSWTQRWERYQLDEFPGIVLFAAVAVAWFVWRRIREVRAELGRRVALERALESALQENRRLAQSHVSVQEAERRRLARELHDELGQHLNAIKIEAVSMRRAASDADEVARAAGAIVESADHLHAVVRDMTRSLRPAGLDELGLTAALENYVEAWRARSPELHVTLEVAGALDGLGETVNIALYRLVQEALTNVSRHAGATRVRIRLEREHEGEVQIALSDDGSGSASPWESDGVGLIGMRQRVESLGGRLRVDTRPQGGFSVSASLPAETVSA
jgi:two-component system sensor histidine kinase UhpB